MGLALGNATNNVVLLEGAGGITISSNISGTGRNLTLQGGGTGVLTLSGANTYTGATTISTGTLQFANTASLYNSTPASWTAANIRVASGATVAFSVGGTGQFTTGNVTTLLTNLGGLGGAPGSGNGLQSGSKIAFDTSNAAGGSFTIADNIVNSTGTGGGAIGVNKIGSGILTLSGTNSFTGGVTVTGGTLVLANTNTYSGGTSVTGATLRLVTGGAGSGGFTFNAGTLASASSSPLSLSGNVFLSGVGGNTTFGDATGTGAITLAGGLQLSSSGSARTVTTVVDVNVTGTLSGSNSSSMTKSGAATLTLSNVGGTIGGANNIIVTAGTLAVTRLANSNVNSSIGQTNVAATVASITLDGGALNYITGGGAASSTNRLLQIGQTTAGGTGTIRNNATSATETLTFSNTNAILYGTVDQTRSLVLGGTNTGLNTLATAINNNGTGVVTVTKQDSGTWVLTATNAYTGATTVNGGTLSLDYGTNNTTKLSDGAALTLGGGTLNLAGGSHTEVVGSTTLTAATSSYVTQSSGSSVLQMGTITNNTGTVNFGASSIATANNLNNATGILGTWATVGGDWASTASSGTNIPVTAYSVYTDVARLGTPAAGIRIIADGSTSNVRLTEGSGSSGTITLDAATTAINTLNQSISGGTSTATVALAGQTLRANGILMGPTAGTLTIGAAGGTAAVSGTLTNQTGAAGSLIFTNNSASDMVINSVLADNSTGNTYIKSGTGTLILAGDNTFTGGIAINAGTLLLGNTGALNSTSGSQNAVTFGANSTGTLALAGNSVTIANLSMNATAGTTFVQNANGSSVANATLTVGNAANLSGTFAGTIRDGVGGGTLALAKAGTGTLTLSAANSYSGGTTLTAGTVVISNATSLGSGGVTVTGSSRINATGGITYANTITVNSGQTLTMQNPNTTTSTATFSGVLSGSGTISLPNSGTNAVQGIIAFTNTANTFTGSVLLSASSSGDEFFTFNSLGDGGTLSFAKNGNRQGMIYTGSSNITFNTRTITVAASMVNGNVTDRQGMDGSATGPVSSFANNGTGTVTFTQNMVIGAMAAGNYGVLGLGGSNTGNNTYAGIIADPSGTAKLSIGKFDDGKWILSGANTYEAMAMIARGTLEVPTITTATTAQPLGINQAFQLGRGGDSGTLSYTGGASSTDKQVFIGSPINAATGIGGGSILNNGTGALTFTNATFNPLSTSYVNPASGTVSGVAPTVARTLTLGGSYSSGANLIQGVIQNNATSGSVALTVSGSVWTLTGANTYTGATNVTAGTLIVGDTGTGSLGATTTTVSAGATLGGSGTIGGATTVSGRVAPGNSIGTLTVNNDVTWNGGNAWVWELGAGGGTLAAPGSSDLLNLTGNFIKGTGSSWAFDFSNTGAVGVYKLVDWNGALTTSFVGTDFSASNLASGLTSSFTVDNTNKALFLTLASAGGATGTTYTLAAAPTTLNILQGGNLSGSVTVQNTGTGTADTLTFTNLTGSSGTPSVATATGTLAGGTLAQGASSVQSLTVNGIANGSATITSQVASATNTTLATTATLSPPAGTINVVVGNASYAAGVSSAAPGQALSSLTPISVTAYTNLASNTVGLTSTGTTVPAIGTTATLLYYKNSTGSDTGVSMAWRSRKTVEASSAVPGDNGSTAVGYLISDVVTLTGMQNVTGVNATTANQTDIFVLQMSYDQNKLGVDIASAANHEAAGGALGRIYLAWNDTLNGGWTNAVNGNIGGTNEFVFRGYLPGDELVLGRWGLDISNNVAWAVLNHNSEFAVIPEPSTLVLGGLALLGFAGAGLRRRRLAKQGA